MSGKFQLSLFLALFYITSLSAAEVEQRLFVAKMNVEGTVKILEVKKNKESDKETFGYTFEESSDFSRYQRQVIRVFWSEIKAAKNSIVVASPTPGMLSKYREEKILKDTDPKDKSLREKLLDKAAWESACTLDASTVAGIKYRAFKFLQPELRGQGLGGGVTYDELDEFKKSSVHRARIRLAKLCSYKPKGNEFVFIEGIRGPVGNPMYSHPFIKIAQNVDKELIEYLKGEAEVKDVLDKLKD